MSVAIKFAEVIWLICTLVTCLFLIFGVKFKKRSAVGLRYGLSMPVEIRTLHQIERDWQLRWERRVALNPKTQGAMNRLWNTGYFTGADL